jgi:CCR4-NOT transcriptional complex subunit CAF120
MYTAHLLRISFPAAAATTGATVRSPLVRGQLEGWVRIRIAGQVDWKKLWMVVSSAGASSGTGSAGPGGVESVNGKRRMSSLFKSYDDAPPTSPGRPSIALYLSQKPKDRKRAFLTVNTVTQAFAVYPERPELIPRSTLIKIEGQFGDEEAVGHMKNQQGWVLAMPEIEGPAGLSSGEMLKWLIGE